MNRYGFLTINSQPAVNGAKSEDPVVGWGPRNGYVYQKAFSLRFLQSQDYLNIAYYVINKRGDLRTNTHSDGPDAVTWGVFPGKEIVQPTIVELEAVSFMAWKDEAYELQVGQQWAKIYDADSPSQRLISELMDTSFLVNVVHNDFHDSEAILLQAGVSPPDDFSQMSSSPISSV
ncbi:hypothetical protein GGX14DRAFT_649323 [Mycena pura]|uniref:MTHFR SAM-binding regulatory domain-containing protein n=1 Tax=Mycena pura TaxID=153505 RepID=A0AAD7E2V3_9AGAR|nr:hypothetical protein GGX14DRAFT_649323 [Mycena pura]